MNLSTLKSLQKRIQEATGADRELDFAICKALGRAPADAIWEVDFEISRTALRPGMIPGSSPFAYWSECGDWGTPCRITRHRERSNSRGTS
jgi:DsbC/DsbD-like thiol-disulfide interchange protein